MLKPKRNIVTREEIYVFSLCFVWYLSYGGEENIIIIIYADFLLVLSFEKHVPTYYWTNKVWWCSITTGVESLPLVFTSTLERGKRCYYYCCKLLMAICFLLHWLLFFLHLLLFKSSSLQKSHYVSWRRLNLWLITLIKHSLLTTTNMEQSFVVCFLLNVCSNNYNSSSSICRHCLQLLLVYGSHVV